MQVTMDTKRQVVRRFVRATLGDRYEAHVKEVTDHYIAILKEVFDAWTIEASNRDVVTLMQLSNTMICGTMHGRMFAAQTPSVSYYVSVDRRGYGQKTIAFRTRSYHTVLVEEQFGIADMWPDDENEVLQVTFPLPTPIYALEKVYDDDEVDSCSFGDDEEAMNGILKISPYELVKNYAGVEDCTTAKRFNQAFQALRKDFNMLEDRVFEKIRTIRTDIGCVKVVPQLAPYFEDTDDITDLIESVK